MSCSRPAPAPPDKRPPPASVKQRLRHRRADRARRQADPGDQLHLERTDRRVGRRGDLHPGRHRRRLGQPGHLDGRPDRRAACVRSRRRGELHRCRAPARSTPTRPATPPTPQPPRPSSRLRSAAAPRRRRSASAPRAPERGDRRRATYTPAATATSALGGRRHDRPRGGVGVHDLRRRGHLHRRRDLCVDANQSGNATYSPAPRPSSRLGWAQATRSRRRRSR